MGRPRKATVVPKEKKLVRVDDRTVIQVDKDIPNDSAVVGLSYDPTTDYFLLKIVSEKFDPVEEGVVIPVMDVNIELVE